MSYVNFPTLDLNPPAGTWYFPTINPTPVDPQKESRGVYSPSLYKEQVIDPLSTQVGGDHYKKLAIQPMEYAMKNKLGPCEFNVVKYVTRWQDKGGIEDLDKAIQCLEILKDSLK